MSGEHSSVGRLLEQNSELKAEIASKDATIAAIRWDGEMTFMLVDLLRRFLAECPDAPPRLREATDIALLKCGAVAAR